MNNHILHAYRFDESGKALPLKDSEMAREVASTNLVWVHLNNAHEDTQFWLKTELEMLDPLVVEALTEESTRPRLEQIGEGCLLILRGVNLNKNADPEDMISLRIWVDDERIISLQRRPLKAIGDFEKKLKKGQVEITAGALLSVLIHLVISRIEPQLNLVDELLDDVEEQILDKPDTSLGENIISIRKKSILFKRYLVPQREALLDLMESELNWMDEKSLRIVSESYNKTCRFIESLDAVRERAQVVRDELSSALGEKLNKNIYILSIITGIFLPLGFLTGLLGINVGGIPGATNPDAFLYFCGILFIIVTLQMLIFVKLKWF